MDVFRLCVSFFFFLSLIYIHVPISGESCWIYYSFKPSDHGVAFALASIPIDGKKKR